MEIFDPLESDYSLFKAGIFTDWEDRDRELGTIIGMVGQLFKKRQTLG